MITKKTFTTNVSWPKTDKRFTFHLNNAHYQALGKDQNSALLEDLNRSLINVMLDMQSVELVAKRGNDFFYVNGAGDALELPRLMFEVPLDPESNRLYRELFGETKPEIFIFKRDRRGLFSHYLYHKNKQALIKFRELWLSKQREYLLKTKRKLEQEINQIKIEMNGEAWLKNGDPWQHE